MTICAPRSWGENFWIWTAHDYSTEKFNNSMCSRPICDAGPVSTASTVTWFVSPTGADFCRTTIPYTYRLAHRRSQRFWCPTSAISILLLRPESEHIVTYKAGDEDPSGQVQYSAGVIYATCRCCWRSRHVPSRLILRRWCVMHALNAVLMPRLPTQR